MSEAITRTEKYKKYRSEIKSDAFYGVVKKPVVQKKVVQPKPVANPEKKVENGFVKSFVAKKRLKIFLYIFFVVAFVGLLLFLLIYFGEQFLNF